MWTTHMVWSSYKITKRNVQALYHQKDILKSNNNNSKNIPCIILCIYGQMCDGCHCNCFCYILLCSFLFSFFFFHYHPIQLFLRRIVKLWWQKKDNNKKTGPKENSTDNFFAGKLFISSRCTEDDGKKFPNI